MKTQPDVQKHAISEAISMFDYNPEDNENHGLSVGEVVPGYSDYIRVKEIVEGMIGKRLMHSQMKDIFDYVWKEMRKKKRAERPYGVSSEHWKETLARDKELKADDKALISKYNKKIKELEEKIG